MAIVTDKEFSFDNFLMEYCNRAIKRRNLKWDNLWIYDGDEGSGKSTLAVAHCYYLSHLIGKKFTVDNIFFKLEDMIEFAAKTEGQVILWDEAALGALGIDHMKKDQKQLVKALMVARKKRHIWIFVIPKFYELKQYIVRRSIGLIHVYAENNMYRGRFTYYKKNAMNLLYNKIKVGKIKDERHYKKLYTFPAKFGDYTKKDIIDWDAYEEKKDEAILSVFVEEENKSDKFKLNIAEIVDTFDLPKEDVAKILGIHKKTLYNWRNKLKKHKTEQIEKGKHSYNTRTEDGGKHDDTIN